MRKKTSVHLVKVKSTLDRSDEEVFFIKSKKARAPIIVKLHTWSSNKQGKLANILELHRLTGWNIIAPEFRGPNLDGNPRARQACASKLAKQDIIDSVNTIKKQYKLTSQEVFLFGGSGGGHMALMMAGYAPKFWTAIAAWCPVTDLSDKGIWAKDPSRNNSVFKRHVRACCGHEIKPRAPIGHIDEIAKATVYIFHGNKDADLPFRSQSLRFYNELIKKHPTAEVYLKIFNGGHDIHNQETIELFKSYLPLKGQKKGLVLSK